MLNTTRVCPGNLLLWLSSGSACCCLNTVHLGHEKPDFNRDLSNNLKRRERANRKTNGYHNKPMKLTKRRRYKGHALQEDQLQFQLFHPRGQLLCSPLDPIPGGLSDQGVIDDLYLGSEPNFSLFPYLLQRGRRDNVEGGIDRRISPCNVMTPLEKGSLGGLLGEMLLVDRPIVVLSPWGKERMIYDQLPLSLYRGCWGTGTSFLTPVAFAGAQESHIDYFVLEPKGVVLESTKHFNYNGVANRAAYKSKFPSTTSVVQNDHVAIVTKSAFCKLQLLGLTVLQNSFDSRRLKSQVAMKHAKKTFGVPSEVKASWRERRKLPRDRNHPIGSCQEEKGRTEEKESMCQTWTLTKLILVIFHLLGGVVGSRLATDSRSKEEGTLFPRIAFDTLYLLYPFRECRDLPCYNAQIVPCHDRVSSYYGVDDLEKKKGLPFSSEDLVIWFDGTFLITCPNF
eukprot:Gb_30257 [translate_table: standard]